MNMKTGVLTILFTFGCLISFAQDLSQDLPFFKERMAGYQAWLNETGMGKILKVHDVNVEPEDYVNLFLSVETKYSNRDKQSDYAEQAWQDVRAAFNRSSTIPFESKLLLKMLHLFELEPGQATVQFYDTYDVSQHNFVFYGIYHENQEVKVKSEVGSKSTSHDFPLIISGVGQGMTARTRSYACSGDEGVVALFNDVKSFMEEEYGSNTLKISGKIIDLDLGIFQISVQPLYREVIQEGELALCEWLRGLGFSNCTTLKKEWLIFTFTLEERNNRPYLSCELEGKFSDKPYVFGKRGNFVAIDNDAQSKVLLQNYGDDKMGRLQEYLSELRR